MSGALVHDAAPASIALLGDSGTASEVTLVLPVGEYALEIRYPAHETTRTYAWVNQNQPVNLTDHARPLTPSAAIREAEATIRPGYMAVYGYTLDAKTAMPVPHAHLTFERSKTETDSDNRGFFSVLVPAIPPQPTIYVGPAPENIDNLLITHPGYRSTTYKNIELVENDGVMLHANLTTGKIPLIVDKPTNALDDGDRQLDFDTVAPPSQSLRDWLDNRKLDRVPNSHAPHSSASGCYTLYGFVKHAEPCHSVA